MKALLVWLGIAACLAVTTVALRGGADSAAGSMPQALRSTLNWGDVDCSGAPPNVGDAVDILRSIVALPVTKPADCPAIGDQVMTGGAPSPTPAPTGGSGDVTTRHSSWYYAAGGWLVAVGEVVNGLNHQIYLVQVTANFYSASNQLLATEHGYACTGEVGSGADSPFSVLLFDGPQGIDHVSLTVSNYSSSTTPPPTGLTTSVTNSYTDSPSNVYHLVGTVSNSSSNTY
jgi:hypothetical protein